MAPKENSQLPPYDFIKRSIEQLLELQVSMTAQETELYQSLSDDEKSCLAVLVGNKFVERKEAGEKPPPDSEKVHNLMITLIKEAFQEWREKTTPVKNPEMLKVLWPILKDLILRHDMLKLTPDPSPEEKKELLERMGIDWLRKNGSIDVCVDREDKIRLHLFENSFIFYTYDFSKYPEENYRQTIALTKQAHEKIASSREARRKGFRVEKVIEEGIANNYGWYLTSVGGE